MTSSVDFVKITQLPRYFDHHSFKHGKSISHTIN